MAPSTSFVNGGYWFTSTDLQLPAANIDATLFSHLFCGYASVDSKTYQVTIPPSEEILINQFSPTVRLSNPDVKTLLSIGGEKEIFAAMANLPANREVFIKSSITAARAGDFDGLDLQWLYPSSQDEMNNFEALLVEWHKAVVDDAINSNQIQLLLVATVCNLPYLQHNIQYPVDTIKQTLDWVNLISYDFYTPTSSKNYTGPSSAFYNRKSNSLSTRFGIEAWTQSLHNLPHKHIVFGIPFYGWAWKLANSHQHDVFSKADGPATGDNISPDGRIDYSNVKKFIDDIDEDKNIKNDSRYLIAYTFCDTTWIAYESEYTIADKIAKAKLDNVLGYFGWNIAGDDEVNTLANAAKTNW